MLQLTKVTVAFMGVLRQRAAEVTAEYVDNGPVIHWEPAYGVKFRYRTDHDMTHGCNPTCGYVYVYREEQGGIT